MDEITFLLLIPYPHNTVKVGLKLGANINRTDWYYSAKLVKLRNLMTILTGTALCVSVF